MQCGDRTFFSYNNDKTGGFFVFKHNHNKINELHCIFRETFKIEGAFEKARTAKAARIED